jgi:predicted O-linked N-acetylglucosamine transferase (SPINDLY family)
MALCKAISESPADFANAVGSSQPFYLAYQGRSGRTLQARYGQAVCRVMEARFGAAPLAPPPSPQEKTRVGIVSGYFSAHSNWKIPIKGWLSQLDRQRFRLFGFHTGDRIDAETENAAALCEAFVRGPLSVEAWRGRILEAAPHVLIYPEVGMDPISVQLAAQRLARVQCNSWGHPDTSGMPTLDYYLSAALMEPADGQDHYTERLVSLPNLSIYYEPASGEVAAVTPAELGCRADATLYWCAQSLYKYLPQFDEVFVRIAQAVGNCQFVFLEFPDGRAMTQRFLDRLRGAFAAGGLNADEYCVMAPRLDKARFLGASRACHVFLDSIGWSGCNSTLESLDGGLPVVTLAGSLMRGRHSSAILTMMGVTDTVAATIDDYVDIATRLALDPVWRADIATLMKENRHRVYRDRDCITALEDFLERVARP